MRLGGQLFTRYDDPRRWVSDLKRLGYRAAFCPLKSPAPDDAVGAFAAAAREADIVIAEVGAWSNPLSPDGETRRAAIRFCQEQLALAERIGARCCVNIPGSRGREWDGWHPDNFRRETFDLTVETTRAILDAVRPARTYFTLEPSRWLDPDSTASYQALIQAVDRPRFAVHLDPVNLVNSPRLAALNGEMIREFLEALGPLVRSVHAKDFTLSGKDDVHLCETRAGLGRLDYRALLSGLGRLDADMPLMLEHLKNEIEAAETLGFLRTTAAEVGARVV